MSEASAIEVVLEAPTRSLGDFNVRRALPRAQRRAIGPFVFLDHMGPIVFKPGDGFDVRPHPHIGLATITYLFEGEFLHRDSLGSVQPIAPGDVNWMIAGRGIAHSERSLPEIRAHGGKLHGIQSWVALPVEHEQDAPSFEHHPVGRMPVIQLPGARLRVIAGTANGQKAPTSVLWPTLYVHASLDAGAELRVDDEHEERGVYVATGGLEIEQSSFAPGALVVLRPGQPVVLRATAPTELVMVGGKRMPEPRFLYWNFVSSSKDRLEQAKEDWRSGRFAKIPGDDVEFVPLPE